MLLLSSRACSETAKRNSVCFEISFDKSSSLIETSQLIWVANWLTAFLWCVKCGDFAWLRVGSFTFGAQFLQIFGRVDRESAEIVLFYFIFILFIYLFQRVFSRRGVGWGFCILHGVISKYITVLCFFVVFELAFSRWNLLKVNIS